MIVYIVLSDTNANIYPYYRGTVEVFFTATAADIDVLVDGVGDNHVVIARQLADLGGISNSGRIRYTADEVVHDIAAELA